MRLRSIGLFAQEFEAGPYTFLIFQSIPVAYRHEGEAFRTQKYFSKAFTRALNKWLLGVEPVKVSQDQIVQVFEGISRYSEAAALERRQDGVDLRRLGQMLMRLASEAEVGGK